MRSKTVARSRVPVEKVPQTHHDSAIWSQCFALKIEPIGGFAEDGRRPRNSTPQPIQAAAILSYCWTAIELCHSQTSSHGFASFLCIASRSSERSWLSLPSQKSSQAA